ncbi:MAG TPA: hypothetical protein VKA68_14065 [bacterium]|nr:hypothetical protein [bacterium]
MNSYTLRCIWLFGLVMVLLNCRENPLATDERREYIASEPIESPEPVASVSAVEFTPAHLSDEVTLLNLGGGSVDWTIIQHPPWIAISEAQGRFIERSQTLRLDIRDNRVRSDTIGTITIETNVDTIEIWVGYFESREVTESIIERANQIIIDRVGRDFFYTYISLNHQKTHYRPPTLFCIKDPGDCSQFLRYPHFLMVYDFVMPDKSFVEEFIEFVVDTSGAYIEEGKLYGVPNCRDTTSECAFPIDEKQAKQIACNAGLERGIEAWRTSFHWYGGAWQTYVWSVSNTLGISNLGTMQFTSHGKTVIIDANSGVVLEMLSWVKMV